MIPFLRQVAGPALRIAIAVACGVAIWSSLCFARADYLFHKDTAEAIRAAIRLEPDAWPYYMRLAQIDSAHAEDLLATSLRLNRYDAQADIELGLQYEADGDSARAERQMLEAYDVDHSYLPRWSLANYYFRQGNMPAFWAWARSAAQMPSDEIDSLFQLCWRASPDPQKLSAELLNDKPDMLRHYINFLLLSNQPLEVARIAPHLVRVGDRESDRSQLLGVVNILVARNEAEQAAALWRLLIDGHWVEADSTVPNNPYFQREPLPVSFDWSLPEYDGLHSWPGSSGLNTEFSGSEPEQCTIAEQTVNLAPGSYAMDYAYRTSDIPPGTGIRWVIYDPTSSAVVAESDDLSSDELKHSILKFTVPPGTSLLRLSLLYRRTLGTPRISGSLDLTSIQIQVPAKA